jgi:hypothetical protein
MSNLPLALETIQPSKSWVLQHNKRISQMLIQNPWNDPMVKKVGLYEMYIIDALCEALELSAEEAPEVRLGCINPTYITLHKLLSAYIQEPTTAGFSKILTFTKDYLKRPIKLVKWAGYGDGNEDAWPDIRVLDTPDECLSWLLRLSSN